MVRSLVPKQVKTVLKTFDRSQTSYRAKIPATGMLRNYRETSAAAPHKRAAMTRRHHPKSPKMDRLISPLKRSINKDAAMSDLHVPNLYLRSILPVINCGYLWYILVRSLVLRYCRFSRANWRPAAASINSSLSKFLPLLLK